VLDDELTLLDGTEVISESVVIQITGNADDARDLLSKVEPETVLSGRWYYDKANLLRLVAGAR
jgi:hypothetical protein